MVSIRNNKNRHDYEQKQNEQFYFVICKRSRKRLSMLNAVLTNENTPKEELTLNINLSV